MELEKFLHITEMFDTYKNLFSVEQQECVEMYLGKDYSLTEIANLKNVSRQAVYKQLNIIFEKINFFEEALGIYKRNKLLKENISNLEKYYNNQDNKELKNIIEKLKKEF